MGLVPKVESTIPEPKVFRSETDGKAGVADADGPADPNGARRTPDSGHSCLLRRWQMSGVVCPGVIESFTRRLLALVAREVPCPRFL